MLCTVCDEKSGAKRSKMEHAATHLKDDAIVAFKRDCSFFRMRKNYFDVGIQEEWIGDSCARSRGERRRAPPCIPEERGEEWSADDARDRDRWMQHSSNRAAEKRSQFLVKFQSRPLDSSPSATIYATPNSGQIIFNFFGNLPKLSRVTFF